MSEKPEMGDKKSMTEAEFKREYMCTFGLEEDISKRIDF